MTHTLVIAELGSSWRFGYHHLGNAYKLIDAVKECGADVAKFQWTSDGVDMASRRKLDKMSGAASMYQKYLEYPKDWLRSLKAHCDKVGIEFMCTVYLSQDVAVINPLVKRFKISAFERDWGEFRKAHDIQGKEVIVSNNKRPSLGFDLSPLPNAKMLWCVSEYPCPLEHLHLEMLRSKGYLKAEIGHQLPPIQIFDGLSDHTTSTLTGALCVAAGGSIIEKHVRLHDTPRDNPDYPHSMTANCQSLDAQGDWGCEGHADCFTQYVRMIREAERCM